MSDARKDGVVAIKLWRLEKQVEDLQKENQELKKQLHEASIEIQHLIEQDIDCPSSCNKLEELKEQLEASRRVSKHHLNRELDLENQQKEFIEWLEDYIDTLKTESDSVEGLGICEYYTLLALEEVLSKYKETIGVKDEKVNC